ncbi:MULTISPECIES: hypothetical protein [Candidatus Rhabdochlamydia]|uniref:hypothetical protein n=1 Tax=Candidatus Rhabdochlamydia TaxID=292833 RepID=UPI001BFCADEC|nr:MULTISPECIES: hypothetical protein [Rhabdochlamydia]
MALVERLWKILREKTVYNRYYETSVNFFQAIRGFFLEEIPKLTDVLKYRINDKFQVVNLKLVVNPIFFYLNRNHYNTILLSISYSYAQFLRLLIVFFYLLLKYLFVTLQHLFNRALSTLKCTKKNI